MQQYHRAEYRQALDSFQKALERLKQVSDRAGEGTTLNNIGGIYDSLGQYPKALEFYQQALVIRKEIGDRVGEGTTLNNIGGIYDSLGQYPKALEFYQQALVIRKEIGDRADEGTTLNNIGYLLEAQKQAELAVVFLKQSVSTYELIRQDLRVLPREHPVLALGLSEKVPNFNALPNVPDELNGIVRSGTTGIYPGLKLLNQDFTTEAFKKLIDHRIVHIATHGQFVPGNPEDSFLVLGNGQPLKNPQIETMTDLGGIHLVVLSACETAKGGADKEGIEVSGISYYFLTSGAKSVIASLWLVNDTSTSQLMQQFYQNLSTGKSKAEALRQAQRSLLRVAGTATKQTRGDSFKLPTTDGSIPVIARDFSHPYYWAPFILTGNNL
ncbi:MAG: CHAT domain-containing protein [Stenomitos rutilans HA7619-LM2]|jgi:hypothetical protein|nr:CHAT domain-containing protein [Stenomitos rutilans HA7619-LM2]